MKNLMVLFVSAVILFSSSIFGQSARINNSFADSDKGHGWEFDADFLWWEGYYKPALEFSYGMGELKVESNKDAFKKVGEFQLKIGYTSLDSYDGSILEYENDFFFFSAVSDRFKSKSSVNKVRTDSWQFGWQKRSGYGYGIGNDVAVLPYNQRGMIWSNLQVTDNYYRAVLDNPGNKLNPDHPEFDSFANTLNRFDGTFRFGYAQEAGLNIEIFKLVSVGAGYEFNTIYPRTLFWKASGSIIIHEIGQGALTYFVQEVMDGSPAAGPIVAFLLKNGLSYGYYLLTQKDMNWPFSTEQPLTYETFKINIGFAF